MVSRLFLLSLLFTLIGGFAFAQNNPPRIAILDFSILSENGTPIPHSQSKSSDLARLSTLLPRALAALLQRAANYSALLDIPQDDSQSALELATLLLQNQEADQVIVGTLAPVGKSVVISVERYDYLGDSLHRISNTVINIASPDEAIGSTGRLLAELFPGQTAWVPQQLTLLVLEPSALRLPVGRSAQIRPLALDSSGKPIEGGRTLYASSNPSVAMVDENGNISALSPGQATISAQVVGVPRQGNLSASTAITVIPPYFGLRVGVAALPKAGEFSLQPRAGFSLSPTAPLSAPNVSKTTAPSISSDPLTLILSFFQSLLSSGPFTFALELSQDQLDVALLTTQWNDSRYLGIGLVYSQALNKSIATGLGVRLTTGLQIPTAGNMAIPLELVTDVLFNNPGPTVRFSLQTGINLFQ